MNDLRKQAEMMTRQIATDEAHVRITAAAHRHYSRLDRTRQGKCRRCRMSCEIASRISTISSGRSAITSTGNRTASIFRFAGRSRTIFDTLDGVDSLTDKMHELIEDLRQDGRADAAATRAVPADDRDHGDHADMMLTMHSTMSGIFGVMDETNENATAMGQAFDAAKNDDSFYLPRRFSRTRTSSAR